MIEGHVARVLQANPASDVPPGTPRPYGPEEWGQSQWTAAAGYLLFFLLVVALIARLARPRVASEIDSPKVD